eukprot:COSAG04_NODE_456_length_14055_cov_41.823660_9_plen_172_part_00
MLVKSPVFARGQQVGQIGAMAVGWRKRLRSTLAAFRPWPSAADPAFTPRPWPGEPTLPATPTPSSPDFATARLFTPSGSLTKAEEERLVEEVDFFRTNGYLIIPGAISGEALARTQSAYDRVTAPLVGQQSSSGSSDAPRALEREEDLLCLIENPRVVPLLSQVVGRAPRP